jgi:hypothetical protein
MTTEKTAVALRVLTAINQDDVPAERDVVLLRAYCPDYRDMEPDEIACVVIQEAMKGKMDERYGQKKSPTQI